jgi:two-component system, OmpR family, sensor histidine kinase KdpD
MSELFINKVSRPRQFLFSLLLVITASLICYLFSGLIGYKVVALILLLTVSLLAISFDIFPVLSAALMSALIWNYFFIPPRFTFHVSNTEDVILFIMYFVIALINAVLTFKIRQIQKVARKKEERANTIKLYNTLLNSLSHELRTPIATIVGASDTLQDSYAQLSDDDKAILLAQISMASFRLNQQVENLLNMSRLQSGFLQPKKDWCDINEIVYNVVKRIEEHKHTQSITVDINPELPLFKLDKMMLEQIIYNLLNNACLYTPWNSRIYVGARSYSNVLELVIEDNGNGFPENEIDKVFNKFYRLKNTQAGGTGLGLSIVKGFTEALGGTVRLENVRPGGARFTIELPAETTRINKNTELWLRRKY